MPKYIINYERKVQVRQYEMLTIGLTHAFESELTGKDEGFEFVRDKVNQWVEEERARL